MTTGKPLTGRKVLAITSAFFGVVIAANMALLFSATGTFPGLVVKNSYVASQEWNGRTAAQRALGWQAAASLGDGTLAVRVTDRDGRPVEGLALTAIVGRPASQAGDRTIPLAEEAGAYGAPIDLGPGLWRIEIHGTDALGRAFEAAVELVREEAL